MDHRIEARIAALEAELDSLKSLVSPNDESEPVTSDRRGMMKLIAGAAVGAVTGAAILNAQPAAAADGNPVTLGQINDSESITVINNNVNGSVLRLLSQNGHGLVSDGDLGNALFSATGESPLGTGGTAGTVYVDGTGDWWAATVTDLVGNGQWRKLAGSGAAGSLHLLDKPVRVYDSRPGQAPEVGIKAPLNPDEDRTVDITLQGTAVPATANAVLITLTINAPQIPGFATAWPSGPWPGTSNVNFSVNQDIAASATVACGPGGSILVRSNANTNVIIDVSGYYQ